MRLTILGCGTSSGVPRIGKDRGRCDRADPRNRRVRSTLLIDSGDERLLVDCGPDMREQLLHRPATRQGHLAHIRIEHGARAAGYAIDF